LGQPHDNGGAMASIKVAVLVGSLRKGSFNRRLALAVERLAPKELSFEHIRIDDLPFYDQDFDRDFPPVCTHFKQRIEAADAVLFVTPEYNRSIPGVLKNALDVASRPHGSNAFAGKPGAVLGTSPASTGTAMAQQHLRTMLAYLDVAVLGQPEVFIKFSDGLIDDQGHVSVDSTRKFLQDFVDRYVAWLHKQLER
jgi:chromate reductase, NAD(P)H dehydrogenase (quinone)